MAKKTQRQEAHDTAESRGRPKGTPNYERPLVVEIPAACPRCHATEAEAQRIVSELAHAGEIDGRPYTHVVWQDYRCVGCGQRFRKRRYEHRP